MPARLARPRLPVLLALAALLLATAVSAAPARKSAPRGAARDSNEVLVRFGKETITRGDLQRRIDSMPEQFRANYTTPHGRKQLLDRMVEERVWMRDAEANGVTKRPDILLQIEAQKRDLLIRTWVNEVMAKNAPPSDSEAKAYYREHQDEWKTPANVTLRHIQTKTESEGKKVLGLARAKGADWDNPPGPPPGWLRPGRGARMR